MSGWRDEAACRGMDPELFFPVGGVAASTRRLCSRCPVREDCLIEAVADGLDGFWGGTTPKERRGMRPAARRRPPRFRARRDPADRITTETTMDETDETNEATDVTAALLNGQTVKAVAQEHGWPRQRVTALINGKAGWTLDPHSDTVIVGIRHDDTAGETAVDLSEHDQADDSDVDDLDLSGLEELLRRGENSSLPTTRTTAEKVRAAVDDLQRRVKTEAVEQQVLDEIAALEKQLAARRAKLQELRPGKTTGRRPAGDGPNPKDVRAWAASRGIKCPPRGRIPQEVREAYDRDHAGSVNA
ncbi:WhiB family transcriptional regulator [Actinoallomurus sp. CA-142502]|uniref:WhiB family transcriptional regulator n=1 Tax=Actinoallomurus sp. CA-142502 TaxID=3239885 RepID=UPI003D8FC3E4